MERKNRNTATNDVGSQRRIAHIFHGIDHHAVLPSAEKNALPQKRQDRSAASRAGVDLSSEEYHESEKMSTQ